MIEIFLYVTLTVFLLFFLGFGLTLITIPNKLKPYAFWLTPWYVIVFLIFSLVILSLLGFSVVQTAPFLTIFLSILTIVAFAKQKLRYQINSREDIFIGLFVVISILINLYPLIRTTGFLTTISMGNNDIFNYASVPEYLLKNSIQKSFYSSVSEEVMSLLHIGYRWGTPLISSFFLYILNLQGYRFAYIFEVVLFALFLPLEYVLLKILFRQTWYGLFLILGMTAFNVNLLYMVYHVFFGQALFWGIELMLMIYFFIFIDSEEERKKSFTFYDIAIGVTFAALYFTYHEGVIFLVAPLLLYLVVRIILNLRVLDYWRTLAKIALIVIIASSIAIFNAFMFDFNQAFIISDQPIGWTLFRSRIPFANPFEMMGFYSIHAYGPLPIITAVILSTSVVFFILYGLTKIKKKNLMKCFLIIWVLFYYWTGLHTHNFFNYNRVVTYTLPLLLILFTVGIASVLMKRHSIKYPIVFFIVLLVVFFGFKLNSRFIREHVAVDKSFISTRDMPFEKIHEPIYAEWVLSEGVSLWDRNWISYFVRNKVSLITNGPITKSGLILVSKANPRYIAPKVLLSQVVWENEYYILGRICGSDECLINRSEDLSEIMIGKSKFEDSLLLSGWSQKEISNRWANKKESIVRLVTQKSNYSFLIFEGFSLKTPQTVSVRFDNIDLGTVSVKANWGIYKLVLKQPVTKGVHRIVFSFSHLYKPSQVFVSSDDRDLSVNFRMIKLE